MLKLGKIASKFFGNANERKIKSYHSRVDAINAMEPELERLCSFLLERLDKA